MLPFFTQMVEINRQNKLTKEGIKQMIKDNTLPRALHEVYEEAVSWWFHNSTEVLKDNYHTLKTAEESCV